MILSIFKVKQWKVFDFPNQSHDLNPTNDVFTFKDQTGGKNSPRNKQEVKMAAVQELAEHHQGK